MFKCVLFYIFSFGSAIARPSDTVIKWSKDRPLTYADFWATNTGKNNDTQFRRDTLATIDCFIGYDIKLSPKKCSIHAYGAVDPRESYIISRDPEVLRHEQTHFDIAEIYARKLERMANDTVIQDISEYYVYLQGIYKQVLEELQDEQNKYDAWWRNSLGKEYYSKWVNAELFSPVEAGAGSPLGFSSVYEKDGDRIKIEIENTSKDTLFYYVGLNALVDTGVVKITTDIKMFSDQIALSMLVPKGQSLQFLSKKQVVGRFPAYGIKKLQLYVVYYRRPDLRSDCEIIHLTPM